MSESLDSFTTTIDIVKYNGSLEICLRDNADGKQVLLSGEALKVIKLDPLVSVFVTASAHVRGSLVDIFVRSECDQNPLGLATTDFDPCHLFVKLPVIAGMYGSNLVCGMRYEKDGGLYCVRGGFGYPIDEVMASKKVTVNFDIQKYSMDYEVLVS